MAHAKRDRREAVLLERADRVRAVLVDDDAVLAERQDVGADLLAGEQELAVVVDRFVGVAAADDVP